jgi:peptidyl-prolyl cis-trans isomerase SurA
MRKGIWLAISMLLVIAGCGESEKPRFAEEQLATIPPPQRTGLPECSGGFVLAIGNESLTSDEIIHSLLEYLGPFAQTNDYQQFDKQVRNDVDQFVVGKIANILLYQQAKKEVGEGLDERLEKLADAEVQKFIVSFGGDYAQAEHTLKQDGLNWVSFKDYHKKIILSQYYISTKLPEERSATYHELLQTYNNMKEESFTTPAKLEFALIDIELAKFKPAEPNETAEQTGRNLAAELMERLRSGEDFNSLAKLYSHGYNASSGGRWQPVQPESLAKPYDVLAVEAEKIQPGQIAGPIETVGHIFIMKLIDKRKKTVEPFEKVQKQLEARINFDCRKQAVDEFGAKLVQQAQISSKDEFVNFCLRKIYTMSNNKYY